MEDTSQVKEDVKFFLRSQETGSTAKGFLWKAKKNPFFLYSDSFEAQKQYFLHKKEALFQKVDLEPLFDISSQVSLLSLLPSPWLMKDLRKAAERILKAMTNGEKITVFGDYDVDGTTSCAMLWRFFKDLGYPVDIYIPDRLLEGYGLNPFGLRKIAQKKSTLVITVDNGIAAVEACQVAQDLKIEVIITDHHDVPHHLPCAFAILNPKQPGCLFPDKMLAGVGVAFYLMIAIRAVLREQKNDAAQINLKCYLDYVAIGTIADMAPLRGANHILCREGLKVLNLNLQQGSRLGLVELLKCTSFFAKGSSFPEVNSTDIGFKIGPRLNAAGRLGNALNSVDLLRAEDPQLAQSTAHFLHHENANRQELEKSFTQEAEELVFSFPQLPHAFVLHQEHWHPGVVGLVATRILEKFYRPVLVFGTLDGKLKGSGRSTHCFNLFQVLNDVRGEFLSFGGHFHAVGMTLEPQKLPWLQDYLNLRAQELIMAEDRRPPLYIDGFLSLKQLNVAFLKCLEDFEPYGIENPRPRWRVGPVVVKYVKRMGKDLSQNHARVLVLQNGRDFWLTAFGMASVFEESLNTGTDLHVVVEAHLNVWRGRELPAFRVIDCASCS